MDDILQTLRLEVTLDCREGSQLSQVWTYVEQGQRSLNKQNGIDADVSVDDSLKGYLWPYIVRMRDMQFVSGDTTIYDNTGITGNGDSNHGDSEAQRFLALDYAAVEQQYPELVMRASQAAINKELFGREDGISRVVNSDIAVKFLMTLSRAREHGMSQKRLTQLYKVDARSAFHYVKLLDTNGLVVRYATFDLGTNTNLLVLRRFTTKRSEAETHQEPEGDDNRETVSLVRSGLRQCISDTLQASENGYMVEADLFDAIKLDLLNRKHHKYFHRVLRSLNNAGVIETVLVQVADAPSKRPNAAAANGDQPAGDVAESAGGADGNGGNDGRSDNDAEEPSEAGDKDRGDADDNDNGNEGSEKEGADESDYVISRTGKKRRRSLLEKYNQREKERRFKRSGCRPGYSYRRCARFLKPYVDKRKVRGRVGIRLQTQADEGNSSGEDLDMSSSDEETIEIDAYKEKADINNILSKPQAQMGMLAALPIDVQVLRLIALSGSYGTVNRAIQFLMRESDVRAVGRSLDRLESTPLYTLNGDFPGVFTTAAERQRNLERKDEKLLVRVDEFFGREHRKRYFVNPLAQPLIDALTADFTRAEMGSQMALGVASGSHQTDAAVEEPAAVAGPANPSAEAMATSELESDANSGPEAESDVDADAEDEGEVETSSSVPALDPHLTSILNACDPVETLSAAARERRVHLSVVVREHMVLQMLAHDSVLVFNQPMAVKCDKLCKTYYEQNKNSNVLTPEMVEGALRHQLDKRTIYRVIDNLEHRGLVRTQTISQMAGEESAPISSAKTTKLALDLGVDPQGPLVEAFLNQMRDRRAYSAHTYPTKPRAVTELIPIRRQDGAEVRDRRIPWKRMEPEFGRRRREKQAYSTGLLSRARVILIDFNARECTNRAWSAVFKRLQRPPRRIMRAVDLYTYLVENIPENQDDVQVFANCAFRTSYLFTALPLRLFVELCGGIEGLSALLPYIRDGDGDSVEDDEVDIDGVNARLAAPVRALPTRLHELLQDRIQKTRPHIRQLLYALETLQLIKPIRNAKDAMALASPPAAEDAFSRVLIDNPKSLHYGYQLVGRARLLNREGYLKAQSLFSSERMGTVDLTTNYLNDEAYDMFDPLERFRYISNLEVTTRDICADLAAEHPLYGIGIPSHWKRPVKLVGSQMRSLDQHVDAAAETTPLTDVERLREAAAQAGVTPEEARRYYQHVYASMRKAAAKRVNDRERLTRVRKKVREAANRQFYAIQASGKAPEAVRRLNFSEAESRQIIIWNVVLRYHAQEHKHMFALSRFMANMFPTRFHAKSPADALRCHWERMRKQPESRAMIDKMYAVWKYVLRDAVAAGSLVDDPDIEQFDAKSAVLYFDGLLQRKTLNDLVVKYARGIAEDAERGQTQAPAVFGRTSTRNNPARRKVKRTHKQPTGRLPATMRGQEHRYAIEELHTRARDVTHCEFAEDTYRDSLVSHKRRDHAYSTVLTTHRAYGASVDYSCPITTMLANEADGPASEVLRESPLPFYVEPIGRVSTLARTLNAPALAERLASLVDGANIEDQAQCLGEGGYSVGQRYAESVCMQAQVLNLTLTPEREYNVDEGSQLLAQNKDAATRACNSLTRILAISRLRPMAASVGLDSSQKQTSTVVVHETTGATRTNVREAGAGLGVVGEEAGYSGRSDDTATKDGTAENGAAVQRTDAPEERMVPGRGYAASERLYTAISTTLPDELWDTDLSSTVTSLDRHLNAVELRYACSLLASGKLWVRPQYTQLRDHQLHAMSGFKRFEVQDAIEFGLNVVAIQPPDAPMELDKELLAPSELVDRIVLGTVDAVGPLGASELELSALYQKLAGTSTAQEVFSALPADARSALFSAQQVLQSLCRLAALRRVFVVGSGDRRYVSATVYHKHWAVSLNGVERAPRLGLNTSGSVNVAVTGGVLASVLGRVFDNPGISQAALIRRYFAPFVSKFEVLQYLDMLVELGVVRAESVDEDVDARVPHRATYYHLTPEFYDRLPQVASAMATAPNF